MQSLRSNYILIAAGKRFTGKSTIVLKFAIASGKRIIVVNTDTHPLYKDFEIINIEQLKTFKGKNCQVICNDENEMQLVPTILNKYQSNAFVIFEDPQKYISQSVEQPYKNFIINHRMRNFDVAFMYHLLKFVPPYLASNINILLLFKTTDTFGNELKSKYQNIERILQSAERVKKHSDEHYCEVIYDNE